MNVDVFQRSVPKKIALGAGYEGAVGIKDHDNQEEDEDQENQIDLEDPDTDEEVMEDMERREKQNSSWLPMDPSIDSAVWPECGVDQGTKWSSGQSASQIIGDAANKCQQNESEIDSTGSRNMLQAKSAVIRSVKDKTQGKKT